MPSFKFSLLCAISFIGAFLLFLIELIMAKMFLPVFGGSYFVWGACVVFFQFVLLAGYLWAHGLIEKWGIQRYLKIHILLLFLPFLFFPGHVIHLTGAHGFLPLVLDIFVCLLFSIGPVFFVLSTQSLVVQSWLSVSGLSQRQHPYNLFVFSNLGSFVALWAYPFIFEYFLTNTQQLNIWRISYLVFVLLNVLAFRVIVVDKSVLNFKAHPLSPVHWKTALRWLSLGAGSVVMYLSVTNIITYEIAPIPLLWVIPLSIFLLSYALTFKKNPWTFPYLHFIAAGMVLAGMILFFVLKFNVLQIAWVLIFLNIILFFVCLFNQNELIKSRPPAEGITFFYVMNSLGGFLGGVFVSWIAPLISNTPSEFLLGLLLTVFFFKNYILRVFLIIVILISFGVDHFLNINHSIVRHRNYYGIYDVFDTKENVRRLMHGTTMHGVEFNGNLNSNQKNALQGIPDNYLSALLHSIPIGYYSQKSPIGQVLLKNIFQQQRVGVVGLGIGAMSMYSSPQVGFDFYELDPYVEYIARNYFWYLKSAKGAVNIYLGDARIVLANNKNLYDVLIIDAFSGDAIPIYLVNLDAVKMYRLHLNPQGAVLFHVTNRYFDLKPAMAKIAQDLGGYVAVKESLPDVTTSHSTWVIMTWDEDRFLRLVTQEGFSPVNIQMYKPMRTWDDEFSTTLPVFEFNDFWQNLRYFITPPQSRKEHSLSIEFLK